MQRFNFWGQPNCPDHKDREGDTRTTSRCLYTTVLAALLLCPLTAQPMAPTLTAKAGLGQCCSAPIEVDLSWTPTLSFSMYPNGYYEIYRDYLPLTGITSQFPTTGPISQTAYEDVSVSPNANHLYWVEVIPNDGKTQPVVSNIIQIMTPPLPNVPVPVIVSFTATPSSVQAGATSRLNWVLSGWSGNTPAATDGQQNFYVTSDTGAEIIYNVDTNGTPYITAVLQKTTVFTVHVRNTTSDGYPGSYATASVTVTVTTSTTPPPPTVGTHFSSCTVTAVNGSHFTLDCTQ